MANYPLGTPYPTHRRRRVMGNLVKRLRNWPYIYPGDRYKPEGHLYKEAADRIESLEAELNDASVMMDKLEAEVSDISQQYIDANETRIELEADLKRLEYWSDKERMMNETRGTILVEEVQEHDDGSATYTMLMDDQSRQLVINEGVRLIFSCAAYGVDLEDVYDWIASHKEKDETNL